MKLTDKNAILEALKSGRKVFSIGIGSSSRTDKRVVEIKALAGKLGVPIREISFNRDPRGVREERQPSIEALCEDYKYVDLSGIEGEVRTNGKKTLIIALDHIQDPRNFGAILRSAAAAEATAVIIEKKRCCEVTDTVYETSCGGADSVPVVMVSNLRQALVAMKAWGCWIAGADERASKDCYSEDMSSISVLALGSEGEGLSRLIREECDFLVRVPTSAEFPSLNVSVAAGILIFETLRQKKKRNPTT
jgi:23S rRNA (guanosine2251-2'-O)-methyltransferase